VSQLNDFVSTHLGVIGAVIVVGCVVLVLMILMLFIQSSRIALLSERLDDLTQGADGQSLEGVLAAHLDTVVRVGHDLDELVARTAVLEGGARLHFGRLGLVRFNPFDDTAAIRASRWRSSTPTTTASWLRASTPAPVLGCTRKAIFDGQSDMTLGAEESQAVDIAVSQGGGASTARASKAASAGGPAGKPKAAGSTGAAAKPTRPAKSTEEEAKPADVAAAAPAPDPGPALAPAPESEPAAAETGSATPSA